MNFRKSLPPTLYKQVTEAHPHRFLRPGQPGDDEVRITSRWRLAVDRSCGPLTELAARDFIKLMKATFGQSLARGVRGKGPAVTVAISEEAPSRPEGYRISVTSGGIVIDAHDDEGAMRALFHLGRRMLNRRGPFVRVGETQRSPYWALRITSPVLHRMRDEPQDYLDLPDAYLLNMARYGYNATYLYMDWFDYMTPAVAGPLAKPGAKQRLAALKKATERLAGFGIRLYFHINTLAMPVDHTAFKKSPTLRGAQTWENGLHCLCSSSPKVLTIYQKASQQLFKDVPQLAGAVLITGGECLLHCYTRPTPKVGGTTNCERCAKRAPEQVIAGVVNAINKGAKAANPDADVLMWPYSAFSWGDLNAQKRLLDQLDTTVGSLVTFEKDDWKSFEGTSSFIFDYTISSLGPSPRYRELQSHARSRGLKTYARTECSQAIEIWNVPRIPVMHRWAQRYAAMREAPLTGVHTAWRFYGFCAQRTDEIVDYFTWAGRPNIEALLHRMAARDFGPSAADHVTDAWRKFSDTLAIFPFSAGLTGFPYFRGPFKIGTAHPLIWDATVPLDFSDGFTGVNPAMQEGLNDQDRIDATRTHFYFTDMVWTQPFGAQKLMPRLERMDRLWREGMQLLRKPLAKARNVERAMLENEIDIAAVIGCMFRTARNLLAFQMVRESVTTHACHAKQLRRACEQALTILHDELDNAHAALEIVTREPSLGYGATYGYSFDADMIREKIEHTQRQIDRDVPEFYSNYAFHICGLFESLND